MSDPKIGDGTFAASARVYNLRLNPEIDGVYIGRAGHGKDGTFGNPVILGAQCPICHTIHKNTGTGRIAACECYEAHLERRLAMDPAFAARFDALEGRDLMCFCAPKGGITDSERWICHGQVMITVLIRRRTWGLRLDQQGDAP